MHRWSNNGCLRYWIWWNIGHRMGESGANIVADIGDIAEVAITMVCQHKAHCAVAFMYFAISHLHTTHTQASHLLQRITYRARRALDFIDRSAIEPQSQPRQNDPNHVWDVQLSCVLRGDPSRVIVVCLWAYQYMRAIACLTRPRVATPSLPRLRRRLCETSKRNCALTKGESTEKEGRAAEYGHQFHSEIGHSEIGHSERKEKERRDESVWVQMAKERKQRESEHKKVDRKDGYLDWLSDAEHQRKSKKKKKSKKKRQKRRV